MNLMVMLNQQKKIDNLKFDNINYDKKNNFKENKKFSKLIEKNKPEYEKNIKKKTINKEEKIEKIKKKISSKLDLTEVKEEILTMLLNLESFISDKDLDNILEFGDLELEIDLEKAIVNFLDKIPEELIEGIEIKSLETNEDFISELLGKEEIVKNLENLKEEVSTLLKEVENKMEDIELPVKIKENSLNLKKVVKNNTEDIEDFEEPIIKEENLDDIVFKTEDTKVARNKKENDKTFVKDEEDLEVSILDEEIEVTDSQIENTMTFDTKIKGLDSKNKVDSESFYVPEEVDTDFVDQIIENVKVFNSEEENIVEIQLKPEHLGKMSLEFESIKGEIVTKIKVDNYETKNLLEINLDILQKEMEELGHEIKSVEVYVSQDSDFNRDRRERQGLWKNKTNPKFKKLNLEDTNYSYTMSNSIPKEENYVSQDGLNLTV